LGKFPGGYKNIRPFVAMHEKFSVIGQVSFRATRMSRVSPGLDTDDHDRRVIPANHTHGWTGRWGPVAFGSYHRRIAPHTEKLRHEGEVQCEVCFNDQSRLFYASYPMNFHRYRNLCDNRIPAEFFLLRQEDQSQNGEC